MKKKFLAIFGLIGLSLVLISWGSTGHNKISLSSGLSFNPEMAQLNGWISFLAAHASDADYRKSSDPNEGPKHYIDLDNYSMFNAKGRIPQTLDSVISLYGTTFVNSNGTLPWATLASYDSLVNCFKRRNFDKAVIFAADLGHYVADGHMPLHITRNYDGQFSDNKGIHSRYESTMINAYISQISYQGAETTEIPDVRQFVFNYLYANYAYVASVLAADNYARTHAGNTYSSAYTLALWNQTKSFTIPLFSNASNALSKLIYTAWVQAGKPSTVISEVSELDTESDFGIKQISPNPIHASSLIAFTIKTMGEVKLLVLSSTGKTIKTLVNTQMLPGNYSQELNAHNLPSGVYFIMLKSDQFVDVKQVVITN